MKITEKQLRGIIRECVTRTLNEVGESMTPAEKSWIAGQMYLRGHDENGDIMMNQVKNDLKNNYYSQDDDAMGKISSDASYLADLAMSPVKGRMQLSRFRHDGNMPEQDGLNESAVRNIVRKAILKEIKRK